MKDYHELYHCCLQEARGHAAEARTANATIAEIYQACTGAKGEPGNWNGAEPVRKLIAERDELAETLKAIVDCYGIGATPEKFCAHVHDFIMQGRKLLAESGHRRS